MELQLHRTERGYSVWRRGTYVCGSNSILGTMALVDKWARITGVAVVVTTEHVEEEWGG